jgi:hypothetical protein
MMRWQAPEASTPWDDDDDDERLEEARLERYEDDWDGQENDWHDEDPGGVRW